MKQLTVITIIFMPLNLLSGIGGMSEWSMMTHGIPWQMSYALFVIILILIALATWYVIKRLENRGRN
jgi:magnesium transporter